MKQEEVIIRYYNDVIHASNVLDSFFENSEM